ncbi:MAG: hypothetical protein U0640_00390 [Phycisphaerales bacterium]
MRHAGQQGSADQGLKLVETDAALPAVASKAWKPTNNWHPGELDSIANVERAQQHVDRQMENLRAILGMPSPDGPRAA